MRRVKLDNGMTVVLKNKKADSIAIQAVVKAGSINEEDKNRGISHFIEHMLFEGTKNRTALEIANEIESLGGQIGAYTSAERTCFYVKVLRKYADKALDVLADIIMNPLFEEKIIEKERSIILSEVKMKEDEPRAYQWLLFQKSLFRKLPTKHPIIGYRKTVKGIRREHLIQYFKNHYFGSNIVLSVVGDTKGMEKEIRSRFGQVPKLATSRGRFGKEVPRKKSSSVVEKRPITQNYLVIGYVAPSRKDWDSYVFDVIQAVLGRGLSGKLFEELRTKRGLGYDVGSHYEDQKNYGFFAGYATVGKKDIGLAKSIILEQIQNVDRISGRELRDAKRYIEGEFVLQNEDTEKLADALGFFEHVGDASVINEYIRNIKKVTLKDIKRVRQKYLRKGAHVMVLLEQKK